MSRVLVEPSRAPRAPRGARATLTPDWPARRTIEHAVAVAAAVLVATGRADLWVLAVLLGIADASPVSAAVVAAAGVLSLERFGSAALTDIAGSQSVLGAAGWHGPTHAVAATWLLAVALVLAGRSRLSGASLGAVAGALLAGPSLAGGVGNALLRVVSLGVGAAIGAVAAGQRPAPKPRSAVALGLAGIALIGLFALTL